MTANTQQKQITVVTVSLQRLAAYIRKTYMPQPQPSTETVTQRVRRMCPDPWRGWVTEAQTRTYARLRWDKPDHSVFCEIYGDKHGRVRKIHDYVEPNGY